MNKLSCMQMIQKLTFLKMVDEIHHDLRSIPLELVQFLQFIKAIDIYSI